MAIARNDMITFLENSRKGILNNYHKKGLRASGRTEQEMRVANVQGRDKQGAFPETMSATLEGPSYVIFEDLGRKAGRFPPIQSIQQWIRQKGIQPEGTTIRSLAYLIARKIAREGTEIHKNKQKGLEIQKVLEAEVGPFAEKVGLLTAQLVASQIAEGLTKSQPRRGSAISPAGTRRDIS